MNFEIFLCMSYWYQPWKTNFVQKKVILKPNNFSFLLGVDLFVVASPGSLNITD